MNEVTGRNSSAGWALGLRRGLGRVALALALGCASAASAQDRTVETRTLRGWTGIQSALDDGPVLASYFEARRPAVAGRRVGNCWLGGVAHAGRFRLTARGFRVVRQSYDDMLERDGRGDEIYIRGDVFMFDQNGGSELPSRQTVKIANMFTGGSYPTADPARGRGGQPLPDDLPLTLWEGELTQQADAVVIVPSIWEWDGDGLSPEEQRWPALITNGFRDLGPTVQNIIQGPADPLTTPFYRDLLPVAISNEGTRPIGSPERRTAAAPLLADAVVLTFDSAMALANQTGEEPVYADMGGGVGSLAFVRLPQGVLPVRFVDPRGLDGDYILYLHLEFIGLTR